MLHIVILVTWYICNLRQQRLAWYYSSSRAVVPLLWNAILLILMYNTLWITKSPFIETATPPPIASSTTTVKRYTINTDV